MLKKQTNKFTIFKIIIIMKQKKGNQRSDHKHQLQDLFSCSLVRHRSISLRSSSLFRSMFGC